MAAVGTALWDPLRDGAESRLRVHGTNPRYSLADSPPAGNGYPLDEIRLKALWPVFHQGPSPGFSAAEWWILWTARRARADSP